MRIALSPETDREIFNLALHQDYGLQLEADHSRAQGYLVYRDHRWHLALAESSQRRMGHLHIDFTQGRSRHRFEYGGGKGQAIAKAVGLQYKSPISVLDATAGLGSDAFVLASLSCSVGMCERSPILAFLLDNALHYASHHATQKPIVDTVQRMHLYPEDACDFMCRCASVWDVVYLDPMFEARQKVAKVKKDMQYLQQILGQVEAVESVKLLDMALQCARYRVVVKRHRYAPIIEHDVKPSYQLLGKSTRFDIYVLLSMRGK